MSYSRFTQGPQNHGGDTPHGEKDGYEWHTWQLPNNNQRDNYNLPRGRKNFRTLLCMTSL